MGVPCSLGLCGKRWSRMQSKNCAAMTRLQKSFFILLVCATLLPLWARAEQADRLKDLVIEGDQRVMLDRIHNRYMASGNVVMRQGTLVIRAHQAEVSETPDGYVMAVLTSSPGQKASFRQKRDGVDEYIEGSADRIEYDSKLDTVRFIGNAVMRRLRGTVVADEVTGSLITYDNLAEVFSAAPGAEGGGRVRLTLSPRGAPASAPASAKPAVGR